MSHNFEPTCIPLVPLAVPLVRFGLVVNGGPNYYQIREGNVRPAWSGGIPDSILTPTISGVAPVKMQHSV